MIKQTTIPDTKTIQLKNIKPLDGLRAIAISLVIFWHYICNTINGHLIFKQLTYWTWSGVDLFFVLSGFLIGRILINSKGSDNYFKIFYVRRFFRIFPAYYLILFIFAIFFLTSLGSHFAWLTAAPYPFYSYLFYIQNFWMSHTADFGPNWLGSTWSLAVEEQFYLILPLLIFLISKKKLPWVLVTGIILAPICRMLLNPGLSSYVLLPARMDSLLIGVLIAYYHLNGMLEKKLKDKETTVFFSFGTCFIVLLLCGRIVAYPGCGGALLHTILMVFYGLLLVIALIAKKDSFLIKFLSTPALSFIARISYMIYLTHQIFNGFFHIALLHTDNPSITNLNGVLVTALSLVTTISFSALSYRFFEKPLLHLGKQYKGGTIKNFALILAGAIGVIAVILVFISGKWKYSGSYYQSKIFCNTGMNYQALGKQEIAKIEFTKSAELNPKNVYALNYLGLIFLNRKQYDSAIHFFTMSFATDSSNYDILTNIAASFAAEKNYNEALHYTGLLLKKDPGNKRAQMNAAIFHCDSGSVLFSRNELDKAFAEYQTAITFDSNNANAIGNIGIVYEKSGNIPLAKTFYARALTKDPANALFTRNLRALNGEANNFELSIHNDSLLLKNDPGNKNLLTDMANLHVNVGMGYMNKNEYDKAYKEFSIAEQIDSTSPNPMGNMGVIYFDKGNYKKAKTFFERALARDPNNAVFLRDLQLLNAKIGK